MQREDVVSRSSLQQGALVVVHNQLLSDVRVVWIEDQSLLYLVLMDLTVIYGIMPRVLARIFNLGAQNRPKIWGSVFQGSGHNILILHP